MLLHERKDQSIGCSLGQQLLPRCSGPHSPPSSHSEFTWCSRWCHRHHQGRQNSEQKQQKTAEGPCGFNISTSVGITLVGCMVFSALFVPLPRAMAVVQTPSSSGGSEHPQACLSHHTQVFTLTFFTVYTAHGMFYHHAEGLYQHFPHEDKEKRALSLSFSHHRAQPWATAPSFLAHTTPRCPSA